MVTRGTSGLGTPRLESAHRMVWYHSLYGVRRSLHRPDGGLFLLPMIYSFFNGQVTSQARDQPLS